MIGPLNILHYYFKEQLKDACQVRFNIPHFTGHNVMARNCNTIRLWKKICTFWKAFVKKSTANINDCDIQQVATGFEIQTAVLESTTSSNKMLWEIWMLLAGSNKDISLNTEVKNITCNHTAIGTLIWKTLYLYAMQENYPIHFMPTLCYIEAYVHQPNIRPTKTNFPQLKCTAYWSQIT